MEGLGGDGSDAYLGVAESKKVLGIFSSRDPAFRGISTERGDLGLIRSRDTLDFLLDVNEGSLTVCALKNPLRSYWIQLPKNRSWVPHFAFAWEGNSMSVEVIDPEQAGKW